MDESPAQEQWSRAERASGVSLCFVGKDPPDRTGKDRGPLPEGIEVAWLSQVHGAQVITTTEAGARGSGDALITSRPGLALSIVTADCVPILLTTSSAGATAGRNVAAIHAGWRGIASNIVPETLRQLAPWESARAWIGPAIGPCCYEVGSAVADAVIAASAPEIAHTGPRGRLHLDLVAAVSQQLHRHGVTGVQTVGVCTRCHPQLCSYRRDGAGAGRNRSTIWLDLPKG